MLNINTKFKDWLPLAQLAGFKMEGFSRPSHVADVETPGNLFDLTLGQLITLSEIPDEDESFYTVCNAVMELEHDEVDEARAVDVVRFVGWVSGEVGKVAKMFKKANVNKPSQSEIKAGINELDFGLFGMLDWFALRMGIEDHDKVLSFPWLRIYKCIDMDNQKRAYEIRLQKIQAEEMRRQR